MYSTCIVVQLATCKQHYAHILWDSSNSLHRLLHIIERFRWHFGWYNHLSLLKCTHIHLLYILMRSMVKRWNDGRSAFHVRLFLVWLIGMVWGACSSIAEPNLFQTHQQRRPFMYSEIKYTHSHSHSLLYASQQFSWEFLFLPKLIYGWDGFLPPVLDCGESRPHTHTTSLLFPLLESKKAFG